MAGSCVNIASRFAECADRSPEKAALVLARDGRTCTFAELAESVQRVSAGLVAAGVRREARVLLFVPPSIELFSLTFALFRLGAVPVMIDPGMGVRQLVRCLSSVALHGFVGISKAHLFRLLYSGAFRGLRTIVTVGRRMGWGGWTYQQLERATPDPRQQAETGPSDPAAILFTSGSTGPAKGVLYTHGNFDAQVELLRRHFGYEADAVDFATFPLFALFDAAMGATCIVPEMDFTRPGGVDPSSILRQLQRHGCTHMFGSPALLERVGAHAVASGQRLPRMRRVITAGAPVRPHVLERFARLLPEDAEILTPYGATEALPISTISHREILAETAAQTRAGAGVCVGRPLPELAVKVIGISDEAIPEMAHAREMPQGEIGEIVVWGPNVTREYWALPEGTARAKIRDADGRLLHRMGDVGYFDAQGRLWYCGRKSHRVQTACGTLFTEQVEALFNEHPLVRRTALVGVGPPGRQLPVICFEPHEDATWRNVDDIPGQLEQIAHQHPVLTHACGFLPHGGFPVDVRHNAKIFREKLADWAKKVLGSRVVSSMEAAGVRDSESS